MKKVLLIIILFPFIVIPGNGQNSIAGKITIQETNFPLPGAIIYLPDLKQGTISDPDGNYHLGDLPSGNFLVEIKSVGYRTFIRNLHISGEVRLDVTLEESAVEMNEVIVTGSVATTQKLLNPIPTFSVNHQELQRNSSTNIIDDLTRIPGISQVSTGNAISKPVIRGLGYNRVLVLNDDIRQEGQQWGDEHGVEIDDNSIDRVEIIKGPGSLVYGSDALAGVLNFISAPSLPQGTIEGNIESKYATNNKLMEYSANNRGNINGVNWLIQGTYKLAGNFRNKYDDIVYNSGYSEKNVSGYLGLTKKWGYSFLRFSSFNEELGIIEGERDSLGRFVMVISQPDNSLAEVPVSDKKLHSYDIDVPRQQLHHNKIQLNSKFFVREGSIQTDFGFQNNVRKEFGGPVKQDLAGLDFQLKTFTYDVKYNLAEISGWRNIAGISGMLQANTNKGDDQLIPNYKLNDVGAFFTTQKTWNSYHISAGIRFDNRFITSESLLKKGIEQPLEATDYKFEGFNRRYSNISFGVGISKNISEATIVKLNYSKGFRAPNLAELATNGVHEGTFRYESGNNQLKSETSHQLDAGLAYNTHHISVDVNTFVNNVRHYIFLKKLMSTSGEDSIPDPQNPSPAFIYTQGNAFLYGGEIGIDIHPHPFDFVHLQQSFSLVKGLLENQSDSTRHLPFVPAPQYRAELRLQPIKMKSFQNPYILLEYFYYFKQNNVFSAYNTETVTPAYNVVNFGLGSDIMSGHKKILIINFQITNLMNVAYQNHLSRLKYAPENLATGRTGVFNPGRSFSLKIQVPLYFKG